MALIGGNIEVQPPNLPPEWIRTPVPIFTASTPGTYALADDVVDQEGDTITYALTSGTFPTGVTMSSAGLITATSAVASSETGFNVTANDGTNSPVASPSFNVVVQTGAAKRWNPGHYIKTTGNHADTDQVDYWNGVNSTIIDTVEDIPEILGAYVTVAWGVFNPTGSTYDWTQIDNTLSILVARGKKMIVELNYKGYHSQEGLLVPADLRPADVTTRGWWGGVHRTATMTRFIAAMQAFADRYDDNPNVEMVTTQETAPSFGGSGPSDYDKDDYVVELKRMYDAGEQMFSKINWAPQHNYLSGYTSDILEYLYNLKIGFYSPDARPNVVAWQMYEDDHVESVRDYRGQMCHPATISSSTIHDVGGIYGPAATHINRCQQQQVTHLCWITWSTQPGDTWSDIKTAIQADPTLQTACPTQYGSCEV